LSQKSYLHILLYYFLPEEDYIRFLVLLVSTKSNTKMLQILQQTFFFINTKVTQK